MPRFHCVICNADEDRCQCAVKDYCVLCLGGDDVRLWEDGLYYCRTCREACDYRLPDTR